MSLPQLWESLPRAAPQSDELITRFPQATIATPRNEWSEVKCGGGVVPVNPTSGNAPRCVYSEAVFTKLKWNSEGIAAVHIAAAQVYIYTLDGYSLLMCVPAQRLLCACSTASDCGGPLHIAAAQADLPTLSLLSRAGANIQQLTRCGQMPAKCSM